jgi:LEA14-like dessication related protein
MKTKIIGIITMGLVLLGFTGMVKAVIIDVSVATNKPVYELGEEVVVFVIAYNPNPEPVTLTFPTSMQASYLMDNIYNWKEHHGAWQMVTEQRIEAFSSHTWTLVHGTDEMETYLPMFGTHTIAGEVLRYGQSVSVEFQVVPEPSTLLLLVVGFFAVRTRNHRPSLR